MDTGLQIRQDGNLCHQEAHSLVWEIEERECNLYFFFWSLPHPQVLRGPALTLSLVLVPNHSWCRVQKKLIHWLTGDSRGIIRLNLEWMSLLPESLQSIGSVLRFPWKVCLPSAHSSLPPRYPYQRYHSLLLGFFFAASHLWSSFST